MNKIEKERKHEYIPEEELQDVMSEDKEEEKVSRIGTYFNKIFHFYERGSSMKQEITAGISVFLVSVCVLLMNVQLLTGGFSKNIPYSGLYLSAAIVSFIGTLLLGLVCNLPLIQVSSLSLSSVFISIIGANTGLTYANLLTITFVSAVVYFMVISIPPVKKYVYNALPDSVRNALPAAIGVYVIYTALNKMKILNGFALASFSDSALGGSQVAAYTKLRIIMGIVSFILMIFLKKLKAKNPALISMIVAGFAFYMFAALSGGNSIPFRYVFSQNRIWIGINPDPNGEMYTIGLGLKQLQLGKVFTEGLDFSAFTAAGGNVLLIFLKGILTFLFMGMYESEGSVIGANLNGKIIDESEYKEAASKFLAVNAFTNVLAPIFGSAPLSIGKQSSIAAMEGGKTGLASLVCAMGYLLAMFSWLIFSLLATFTATVPEYGHAGFVFPNVIKASFQIADAVMLVAGIIMIKGVKNLKWSNFTESIPFVLTVSGGLITKNIVYGVAFGVIAYIFLKMISLKEINIKSITVPNIVLAVLSAVMIIITF